WNQYQANAAHKMLMKAGFAVLNPMPTGVLPFAWDGEINHHEWLQSDKSFISVCEAVVRLPGESKGGDEETEFAADHGIPVIYVDNLYDLRHKIENGRIAYEADRYRAFVNGGLRA